MTVRLQFPADGTQEVTDRVVQTLQEGGTVAIDLPEGRWGVVRATDEAAIGKLGKPDSSRTAALMLYDAQATADLVHRRSHQLDRLMRGQIGPLLISVSEEDVDQSLLDELPEKARQAVSTGNGIRLAPPAGTLTWGILRQTSGPLLAFAEVDSSDVDYDMLVTGQSPAKVSPTEVRSTSDGWEILKAGTLTRSDLQRMMAQRIVFVCTGNTCRSPMAEAMFRAMLAEQFDCAQSDLAEQGYEVLSAGIAAMQGAPASPESVQICAAQGVDLSPHASQPLTVELLEQADRLYTMTAGHREAILARYPNLRERVELLSRDGDDVSDPIGLGRDAYEQCFAEITDNLRILIDELTQSRT